MVVVNGVVPVLHHDAVAAGEDPVLGRRGGLAPLVRVFGRCEACMLVSRVHIRLTVEPLNT